MAAPGKVLPSSRVPLNVLTESTGSMADIGSLPWSRTNESYWDPARRVPDSVDLARARPAYVMLGGTEPERSATRAHRPVARGDPGDRGLPGGRPGGRRGEPGDPPARGDRAGVRGPAGRPAPRAEDRKSTRLNS